MANTELTYHARLRCHTRGIDKQAVSAAVDYGTHRYSRGADHYVIGWRDVRFWAERGVDIARFEGTAVVCAADGRVLTTYRKRRSASIGGRGYHRKTCRGRLPRNSSSHSDARFAA